MLYRTSFIEAYRLSPEPLKRFLTKTFDWRGHQTSPTVLSLKGRLPQKLQSKSTLSCEIVQIHSLFRHSFYKETEIKLYLKWKIDIFCCYVMDFEKKDFGIDLIANAFRGSIQNTRLFLIFSSFIFYPIIYLFKK